MTPSDSQPAGRPPQEPGPGTGSGTDLETGSGTGPASDRIVLHMGVHKTGTSSIQATLGANRDLLRAHGVIYPSVLPDNHSHFLQSAFANAPEAYHVNRRQGLTRDQVNRASEARMQELRRELAALEPAGGGSGRGRRIVLSGEDASVLPGPAFRRMRAVLSRIVPDTGFDVLIYTRHPVSFVSSAIQENVKGNGLTIDAAARIHIDRQQDRYRRLFEDCAEAFGEDNVRLRAFEEARAAPGGLMGDFLSALGADPAALREAGLQEVRSNDGICDEVVEFLSWVQQTPSVLPPAEGKAPDSPKLFVLDLAPRDRAVLFEAQGRKDGFLDAAQIDRIWSRSESDRAFLQDRFGIVYERPAPASAGEDRFDLPFLRMMAQRLPEMTVPMRRAFLTFLRDRPVPPARGSAPAPAPRPAAAPLIANPPDPQR